jgi:hypothetical protein
LERVLVGEPAPSHLPADLTPVLLDYYAGLIDANPQYYTSQYVPLGSFSPDLCDTSTRRELTDYLLARFPRKADNPAASPENNNDKKSRKVKRSAAAAAAQDFAADLWSSFSPKAGAGNNKPAAQSTLLLADTIHNQLRRIFAIPDHVVIAPVAMLQGGHRRGSHTNAAASGGPKAPKLKWWHEYLPFMAPKPVIDRSFYHPTIQADGRLSQEARRKMRDGNVDFVCDNMHMPVLGSVWDRPIASDESVLGVLAMKWVSHFLNTMFYGSTLAQMAAAKREEDARKADEEKEWRLRRVLEDEEDELDEDAMVEARRRVEYSGLAGDGPTVVQDGPINLRFLASIKTQGFLALVFLLLSLIVKLI